MWIADRWKDYEVLDTSAGEKLERWGDYILVRPDPQVIWSTPRLHAGWKQKNGHYHRSSKGGGQWEFFHLPDEWSIRYTLKELANRPLTFRLKPFSFKHTGLFPEQAANWEWFSRLIKQENRPKDRPVKVLNLFAYTGGATLAAAAAEQPSPCGRIQGHGVLGQGKRPLLRTGRSSHPLAGGRLHKVCRTGNQKRQQV